VRIDDERAGEAVRRWLDARKRPDPSIPWSLVDRSGAPVPTWSLELVREMGRAASADRMETAHQARAALFAHGPDADRAALWPGDSAREWVERLRALSRRVRRREPLDASWSEKLRTELVRALESTDPIRQRFAAAELPSLPPGIFTDEDHARIAHHFDSLDDPDERQAFDLWAQRRDRERRIERLLAR
jgi:hypothetical protein